MSLDVLKKDLKEKQIRSLYLFYGPEEFLKKYYLDAIEKDILDPGTAMLNKQVLEGKQSISRIEDACETLPVFSERRLVIVKSSGFFKSRKEGEGKKQKGASGGDDFSLFLQNVPSHACLIFLEDEVDKRLKVIDLVKKNGLVVEFEFQKPVELVKWVKKVFKSYGKEIGTEAASRIVDNSEQGMTDIRNEIDKIALFAGTRNEITVSDVEAVCTRSIRSRIFDLTDAICEKNPARALSLLDDMIALKEPVPKILFMIARQFRQILEMKLLKQEGLGTEAAASRMGVTPYAAGKISRHTGRFTIEQLKAALEECLALDMAIKSGRMGDRMAAELLIAMSAR